MKTIIRYGDVVTYFENDCLITHRIIEKEDESRFVTKGDNNNETDREIEKNKIFGKVIFSSLFLGRFIKDYLKYIFAGFSLIIIFANLYLSLKGRKNNERIKDKNIK